MLILEWKFIVKYTAALAQPLSVLFTDSKDKNFLRLLRSSHFGETEIEVFY